MIVGSEITEEVLASYPENKDKPITKLMLAKAATEQMGMPDGKDNQFTEAIKHVNGMKEEYGNGASTLLVIANQTGETLNHLADRSWSGDINKYPYDPVIKNGQISVVLHTKTAMFRGSVGSIIYRSDPSQDEFVLGFWTPYIGTNKSYINAGKLDEWNKKSWSDIYDKLDDSGMITMQQVLSYQVSSTTGGYTSPVCIFTMRRIKE